jgi:hypothetical protein
MGPTARGGFQFIIDQSSWFSFALLAMRNHVQYVRLLDIA